MTPWSVEQQREYLAVQNGAGWLDRSGVGKIAITGEDRLTWLQGMISNDTRLFQNGVSRLSAYVLTPTAHIRAEITLCALLEPTPFLLLLTQRESVATLLETLEQYLIMEDVTLEDVSEAWDVITVQGAHYGDVRPLFVAAEGAVFEADHTGYGGMDWIGKPAAGNTLRQRLRDANLPEISPEVAELLRIEAGIPRAPHELNASVLAPEAGNTATHISLTKGCYVGQEIVARVDSRGRTHRALAGFVFAEQEIPAAGDRLFDMETDREVGRITSVAPYSPAMQGRPIALGYIRHENHAAGARLIARGDGGEKTALVTYLPFGAG